MRQLYTVFCIDVEVKCNEETRKCKDDEETGRKPASDFMPDLAV